MTTIDLILVAVIVFLVLRPKEIVWRL